MKHYSFFFLLLPPLFPHLNKGEIFVGRGTSDALTHSPTHVEYQEVCQVSSDPMHYLIKRLFSQCIRDSRGQSRQTDSINIIANRHNLSCQAAAFGSRGKSGKRGGISESIHAGNQTTEERTKRRYLPFFASSFFFSSFYL